MDDRIFEDRRAAGRALAEVMQRWRDDPSVLLLALPRGGVPVAVELAGALNVSLDIFLVRKLGAPGQPELAIGAVASGNACLLNRSLITLLGISADAIAKETATEQQELARREHIYREDKPPPECAGKTVILVDDGVATGASMRVAVSAVRKAGADRVVVAVPVAPPDALALLSAEADEVICLSSPRFFGAVGAFYRDFTQVSDDEVLALLAASRQRTG